MKQLKFKEYNWVVTSENTIAQIIKTNQELDKPYMLNNAVWYSESELSPYLMKMSREDKIEYLRNSLTVYPDYPSKGILFQDVSTLFSDKFSVQFVKEEMKDLYADIGITKVVGLESRGFPFGMLLAGELNAGFVMARKPNKLPGDVLEQEYTKEYGTDKICLSSGSIDSNDVVLIHDDLIATGGSLEAVIQLVKKFNPKKIYVNCLVELTALNGKSMIPKDVDYQSLIKINGVM